jgi:hypothetical protein
MRMGMIIAMRMSMMMMATSGVHPPEIDGETDTRDEQ